MVIKLSHKIERISSFFCYTFSCLAVFCLWITFGVSKAETQDILHIDKNSTQCIICIYSVIVSHERSLKMSGCSGDGLVQRGILIEKLQNQLILMIFRYYCK